MAVVGSAEVVVRAITLKVKDDIAKAFRDATPALSAAGRDHAKAYTDAFSTQVGTSLGKSVETSLFKADTTSSGTLGGARYSNAFNKSVESNLSLDSAFDRANSRMEKFGRDGGSAWGRGAESEVKKTSRNIENEMGNAGRRGGDSFVKGFMSSGFAKSLKAASDGFHLMFLSAQTMGTALAGLVGGLSSVVSGLFAMASAASNAVGVLAALPGAISVVAQAGIALKLAFSGVGDAVKAGLAVAKGASTGASKEAATAAKAVASAERQIADATRQAARQVADAKSRLRDAYDQSARAAADAAKKVQDAENDLKDAQVQSRIAQLALTDARKAGLESLQQLGFSAEDAALAEQRAGLNLQDALQKLQQMQNLPPDNRMRVDAELAFKEADLNYREAKDRAADLAAENNKAAKAGVDGTKEVVDAKKDINDAQKKEQDAEEKLAKSRQDQAQTARDNAKQIAEAQLGLTRAQQDGARNIANAQAALTQAIADQSKAAAGGTAAIDKYNQALKDLSPAAQSFVTYLVSMQDEVKKLKAAAGQELFPQLQSSLETLTSKLFPVLEDNLKGTGDALGGVATKITEAVTSSEGLKHVGDIMKTNNDVIKIGGDVMKNLTTVMLRVMDAAGPLIKEFAEWVKQMTAGWEASTKGKDGMDKLSAFFKKAGDTAKILWNIIKNLWGVLKDLKDAANDAGFDLLKSFEGATKALKDFTGDDANKKQLQAFFKNAGENVKVIAGLLGRIAKGFLRLGASKEVGDAFKRLGDAGPGIDKIFDGMIKAAPKLADLAVNIVDILGALATSDSIQTTFSTLAGWTKKIADFLNGPIAQGLLKMAAPVLGALHAFFLMSKVVGIFGKVLGGSLVSLFKMVSLPFKIAGALAAAGKRVSARKAEKAETATGARRAATGAGQAPSTAFGKAAATAGKQAQTIGKAITDGIRKGMNSRTVTMYMQEICRSIITTAKTTLKIKSPSLVFTGIGEDVGEGFERGIKMSQAEVDLAAKQMAAGAVTAAKSGTAGAAAAGAGVAKGAAGGAAGAAGAGGVVAQTGKFSGAMGKAGGALKGFGKIAGAVGKGLGGAMSLALGPIGMIASIAIPLLIEGFKWLYKNSPGFKKFIDGIVKGFKEVFHWLAEVIPPALQAIGGFFKTIWGGIKIAFDAVAKAILWIWDNVLSPPIQLYIAYLKFLWKIVGIVWDGIKAAIALAIEGIKWYWDNVLKPVIDAIVAGFKWVMDQVIGFWNNMVLGFQIIIQGFVTAWNTYGQPFIDAIVGAFQWVWDKIKEFWELEKQGWANIIGALVAAWEKYGKPFIDAVVAGFKWVWDRIKGFFDKIAGAWTNVINGIKAFWNKYGVPIIDGIRQKWSDFKDRVVGFINGVKTGFQNAINAIKTWWDKTGGKIVDAIQQKWEDFGDGIAAIWDAVKDAPKTGLRNLINNLNSWLVEPLNALTKLFNITIPKIPMPAGLAGGGPVEGQGGPTEDNQVRRLSVGEYVVRERAARRIGRDDMDYMNRTGQLPPPGGATRHALPGDPRGGWLDTIKEPAEWAAEQLKKGAGKAWDAVMAGFEHLLPAKGAGLIEDLVWGIWDKLRKAVKERGDKEQAAADKAAAASDTPSGMDIKTPKAKRYGDETFTKEQLGNAVTIAKVAAGLKLSKRAIEVALMTAMVESGMRNLNYGDRDSIGIFQQRAAWGPYGTRHNVAKSAKLFFLGGKGGQPGLTDIKGWQNMSRGRAAQRVQVSAFPDRYASKQNEAIAIVKAMGDLKQGLDNVGKAVGWTYPTRPHYNGHNWAGHNPSWGDDIGAPMGTKVVAANAGKVSTVKNLGNRSYGRYIVISHGKGVSTLYAHLKSFNVRSGQRVGSGQKIALSDNSGGSRGAHLHFEYRPSRDTIKKMRALGVKGFAEGGTVKATAGGILAMIGEAGRSERVEPLDSSGLSARDRAMIEMLSQQNNQGTGNIDVRVFIGDRELTDLVDVRINQRNATLVQDLNVGTKRRYL